MCGSALEVGPRPHILYMGKFSRHVNFMKSLKTGISYLSVCGKIYTPYFVHDFFMNKVILDAKLMKISSSKISPYTVRALYIHNLYDAQHTLVTWINAQG